MACDLLPPEAKPIDPPITTTSNPITTPAPTEPPGRKNLLFGYLTASKLTYIKYGHKKAYTYFQQRPRNFHIHLSKRAICNKLKAEIYFKKLSQKVAPKIHFNPANAFKLVLAILFENIPFTVITAFPFKTRYH